MLSETLLTEVVKQVCKNLASPEVKLRNKGLKRLKKVIALCNTGAYSLESEHFILLFKGLHYWLWSQDKLLNQEHLADEICGILTTLKSQQMKLHFINSFFETEVREWKTLDKWRTDKFLMLIRKFFRQSLMDLSSNDWEYLDLFLEILQRYTISIERGDGAFGMRLHFIVVYFEELSNLQLSNDLWMRFLRPYFRLVPYMPRDHPLLKRVEDMFFLILPPVDDEEEPLDINYKELGHFLFEVGGTGGKNMRQLYEWSHTCCKIAGVDLPTELPTPVVAAPSELPPQTANKKNKRKRKLERNKAAAVADKAKAVVPPTPSPPKKRLKLESPASSVPATPSPPAKKAKAAKTPPVTPSPSNAVSPAPKSPSEKKKKDPKRVSFGKIYRKPFKKKDAVKTPSPGTITGKAAGKGILKQNLRRQSMNLSFLRR